MKSVSCIIPLYGLTAGDNLRFFKELLVSVRQASQPFSGNYEVILVNDDRNRISEEDVLGWCHECRLSDRVKYIENEENGGQAYSRNIGAAHATYDYLHFVDQDDYISPDFYDPFLKAKEASDFYISTPCFDKDGDKRPAYTPLLKGAYGCAKEISQLWYLLFSNIVYSPGQLVMSKASYEQAGGFPVLNHRGADDFALFYKLVFSGRRYTVSYMAKSKFYYRIHAQQNSKLSSTGVSACEFLGSQNTVGFKQRAICIQKSRKWAGWLGKLFYVLFFKRA